MSDIPQYKSQEKLQPATQQHGFLKASTAQASAGNALTNIGSEIAVRSSVARSQQAGVEMGKTPSGDLLPAFNKTDEAFQQAYRTTAQATLTLQGEALLAKGLTTVNQANKLTPDLIDNFNSQMSKGIDAISGQAPSIDKTALKQNLQLGLLTAENKLRANLAKQQKEDLKDNFAAYSQSNTQEIFNVASNGDIAGGAQLLSSYQEAVAQQVESGLLSKLDGQSLVNTARTTYLTGREFAKAQDAETNGELDRFLSDYSKNPPSDMTPTEWVEVGNKLLTLVNLQDAADSRNQALLVSEGGLRIVEKRCYL